MLPWPKWHMWHRVLLRASHPEIHDIHLPLIADVDFDPSVKGLPSFSAVALLFFSLALISSLWGDTLKTMQMSCPLSQFPLDLASSNEWLFTNLPYEELFDAKEFMKPWIFTHFKVRSLSSLSPGCGFMQTTLITGVLRGGEERMLSLVSRPRF